MSELNVRIEKLEPMRVASAWAYGTSPENDAWEKLLSFAEPKGLFNDPDSNPVYGFNNPNPTKGQKEYGYEFWIKIKDQIKPEGEIRIGEFYGGPYAVARCEVSGKLEKIYQTWQELYKWCIENHYKMGYHKPLEKQVSGGNNPEELVLDLYFPVIL